MSFLRPLTRVAHRCTLFQTTRRQPTNAVRLHSPVSRKHKIAASNAGWIWGSAIALSASLALSHTVHLDAPARPESEKEVETVVDVATSITFPTIINVPAKIQIPPLTLMGFGVRTVSFLKIKVYSVGFYADLSNPSLNLSAEMSPEEKITHIVNNTGCVVRIVPTRTTSYTHLRDAFMRALQGRMSLARQSGSMSEEEAQAAASPMRKLKSMFPNSPLEKHTPLDIYLTPPFTDRPRALIFRDMGSIENDWVATELVLHYFAGDGPSPALKSSVMQHVDELP
ncbi:chalcone-flavanone isomerase-domain-containing protein [Infundibulicybe gibba]|nr:chalcone-flavanone isomerase-domain-containing protein [Infundibulicybe gibba]